MAERGKVFFYFYSSLFFFKTGLYSIFVTRGETIYCAKKNIIGLFFVSRMAKTKVHSLTTVQGATCQWANSD